MNKLRELIRACRFEAAARIVLEEHKGTIEDILLRLAYEDRDIRPYAFICSLLTQKPTAHWHYVASLLLSQPLCHLPGAYQVAFYHAQIALRLAPEDVEVKEYLLFFRDIPARLLDEKEAVRLANEILTSKPDSQAARRVLRQRTD